MTLHFDKERWPLERYSALVDHSTDCVYLLDLTGKFIDANTAALNLLGIQKEEVPALSIWTLITPEHLPLARQRLEQILKEGCTAKSAEFELICKDRRRVFVETKSSIVLREGRPVAIQGIARDITDRRRNEDALRESEGKFRSLAENMRAAVGIVQGIRFIYANEYMAQMLGYTVEEIISSDFPQLVHPSDRERLIELARRRQRGEDLPNNYEFRALSKSGEIRWMDFSVGPMVYQGKPAIIGTGIDITERKRTEERLRAYTLDLKLLADCATRLLCADRSSDAFCDVFNKAADHLGVKIYVNYLVTEDGARLHMQNQRGLDPVVAQQIESINLGQLLCGTVAQEKRSIIIEHVQQSTDPKSAFLRPLGIRAYACHPLIGRNGVIGTLSFCADDRDSYSKDEIDLMQVISHQAAMSLDQQRLADELERRARELTDANAAKDHFLAVLSHELRTPLTPVVMGVSMLQDTPDLDSKARETLEIIRLNVDMEARLIDDLLDVTRIARGKIELNRSPVELSKVIDRVVEVCKPDIEARRLHFGVDMAPDEKNWINADPARMQQVFWNLLKNSIKFTPSGGYVGIRCWRSEEQAFIEVNDTGIGIEPDALERIFNAFEQTERTITRQFGGLGLGLAISKSLVEMHGGQIEAYSKGRNKGAAFRVRLPLSGPAIEPMVPESVVAEKAFRPMHILLVEDHGVTAQMIRAVLNEKGYTVELAGDVATALELADQQSFDLMLSDLGLPDGSGHDLMRELRKRGKKFPGIALSGYGQEEDISRSFEAGFTSHLIKPASRETIYHVIAATTAA